MNIVLSPSLLQVVSHGNILGSYQLHRLGFKTCLSKTKTKTKTLMSKTKTDTQDLQDQYWKSHGKQKIQHTGRCTQ